MISFVICFHSSRTENLRQTLRFLMENEECGEVILMCNDNTNEKFPGCSLINMGMSEYRKTKMCNEGVRRARGDMVALLDSDRVLPRGYFFSQAKEIKKGEFVTCEKMIRLVRPHKDDEIRSGKMEFQNDNRTRGWDIWRKNLFSGNTLFHKEDYILSGGQDEWFEGYGFADNDMTRNVMSKGFVAKWAQETEIHLYHPAEVMDNGAMAAWEYLHKSDRNLCYFLRKWGEKREYGKRCGCLL